MSTLLTLDVAPSPPAAQTLAATVTILVITTQAAAAIGESVSMFISLLVASYFHNENKRQVA